MEHVEDIQEQGKQAARQKMVIPVHKFHFFHFTGVTPSKLVNLDHLRYHFFQ